jgi:hypothetical protein
MTNTTGIYLIPDSWRKNHTGQPCLEIALRSTDASYVAETGQASIGLIARNSADQFCFCAGRNLEGLAAAEEDEAYAVLHRV